VLAGGEGFDWEVLPELRGSEVEREVVEWGRRSVLAWRSSVGMEPRCEVECRPDDGMRVALLEGMGFARTEGGAVHFRQILEREIEEPRVPDGWSVRGLRDDDIESRATTQREAFTPGSKTTPETWRRLMAQAPSYEREMDSVAVAPDGTVHAAALAWLDEDNRTGEFEPVATRPSMQRRGLGRAVLLRGMRAMRERGMTTAIVRTNASNAAAIALYRSVGFEPWARCRSWSLEVGG
jgi:ribosomal protein S18 acetylase RimI-like enzyme